VSEEQKPKTVEELTNEIKAEAWNKCIVPRLEAIRAWYKHPEWTEGIAPFLANQKELNFRLLVKGNTTPTDDKFVMGRISMLMDILDMPGAIDRNIQMRDQVKSQPRPQGEAGY
jgi:hypothetical protein